MSWWHRLWRREQMETLLEKELRFHIDQHAEDMVADGDDPEKARLQANLALGGLEHVKEMCRDARGTGWIDNLLQDVRFAIRMLCKNPGFALVAVLVLAFGSGTNSAVFSIFNAVVLRPLPFLNPASLYQIGGLNPRGTTWFSALDLMAWRNRSQVFNEMAAVKHCERILSGVDEPEHLFGASASAECFPLLGAFPILGRSFSSEDFRSGATPVVLIGQRLWQRRLRGDPQVVGKSILLDGVSHIVIGIMPSEFQFPTSESEFWVPLTFSKEELSRRDYQSCMVYARAKSGASRHLVEAEADTISRTLVQLYPKEHKNWRAFVKPLQESVVGDARPVLLLLLGAVAFVLMIACLNVANLLLARGMERSKEIAIRTALGAGRSRIIRQLLTESTLLAFLGGSVGLLLAGWAIKALIAVFSRVSGLARLEQTSIDSRVLVFTLCLCILSSLAFGLIPALQASKLDINEILKETGRSGGAGIRSRRLRNLIIITETALSFVLLTGAALMIRSLYNLLHVNPGFTLQRVLTAQLPLPAYRVPDKKSQPAYYMEILRRIQTLPGVRSAGLATVLPLTGSEAVITISSDSEQEGVAFHSAFRAVSPDYFRAMQIPVVLGRIFTEADTADAQRVAVVNEALARQMWPGQNPIGKNIKWGKGLPVVGMVGNIRHKGLNAEPEPELYLPYLQYLGTPLSSLVVRTDADPVSMVSAMRRTIRDFEPDQPTMNVKTMEQVAYDSLARPRFYSLLLGIFASLAVILATAGVYSVMSYSVSQQQHEIGVRMALGARISQIVAEFVGQGLRYVAIGIAVGIVGAMILTRLLSTMLFEIKPTDPVTYVAVSFFLLTVAIVALLIPARCVTRVNPVVALRHE